MNKIFNAVVLAVFTLALSGCVSTGQKIDYNKVSTIQKNITTEADIRTMFGEPTSSEIDTNRGIKILTYQYKNSDEIKRAIASTTGAVAGGVLGGKVGHGTGQSLASGLGAIVGGFLASNVIVAREEKQYLKIAIGLQNQRVIDFNYIDGKGRSQRIGFTGSVSPL